MSDMHFHCVNCKEDQWLDEDVSCCSFCGSTMLWEIVEEEPEESLIEQAEARMKSFWTVTL